jgi:hypothetical protein
MQQIPKSRGHPPSTPCWTTTTTTTTTGNSTLPLGTFHQTFHHCSGQPHQHVLPSVVHHVGQTMQGPSLVVLVVLVAAVVIVLVAAVSICSIVQHVVMHHGIKHIGRTSPHAVASSPSPSPSLCVLQQRMAAQRQGPFVHATDVSFQPGFGRCVFRLRSTHQGERQKESDKRKEQTKPTNK